MGEIISYTNFDIENIFVGNINDKIASFRELNNGWDYGLGVPTTKETVNIAQSIAQIGKAKNFGIDAFPATDGGIVLNLYIEEDFIYVTINPNASLDLRHEKGIGEDYDIIEDIENISLEEIIEHLNAIYIKCFSSELYTSRSMIQPPSGSQAKVLRIIMGESQFSMRNAQKTKVAQYVSTSPIFTNQQLEPQFYIAE